MLSPDCIRAYKKQFPKDNCGYDEGFYEIVIYKKEEILVPPEGETDESFFSRLERCKIERKNLFYEEWMPFSYLSPGALD